MTQRRRFSAEYKREAVAMLEAPGVRLTQVAAELGIGAAMLGRWRRECIRNRSGPFRATAAPVTRRWTTSSGVSPRHEGAGFFARSGSVLRESVAMKYRMIQRCRDAVSHPADVPVFAGLSQWVLWLGDAAAESAGPGECPITQTDSPTPR